MRLPDVTPFPFTVQLGRENNYNQIRYGTSALLIYILHRYNMFSINSICYNLTKVKYLHIVPLTPIKNKYALNKAKTNSSKEMPRRIGKKQ